MCKFDHFFGGRLKNQINFLMEENTDNIIFWSSIAEPGKGNFQQSRRPIIGFLLILSLLLIPWSSWLFFYKAGSTFLMDFEKAFNKIDWNFCIILYIPLMLIIILLNGLRFFNIRVQGLFTIMAILHLLNLGRGLRQGCPLSLYLFLLRSEVLAQVISHNIVIKGINIKLFQHADDTALFLHWDTNYLWEVIHILDKF